MRSHRNCHMVHFLRPRTAQCSSAAPYTVNLAQPLLPSHFSWEAQTLCRVKSNQMITSFRIHIKNQNIET
ncbi:hypothetical protein I3842_07G054800 [Carya illinoinensis]|uniref:Uncharacterized protein n=1 Tax=Carya illinoinensis TaxID=32201 RepID=A0A922EJ46_CARIL|nr:hypothetical protein I3842_07G054800 [Carya illinoinensis]